jgi:hypothetical protein
MSPVVKEGISSEGQQDSEKAAVTQEADQAAAGKADARRASQADVRSQEYRL